jgi:hypothetical protein
VGLAEAEALLIPFWRFTTRSLGFVEAETTMMGTISVAGTIKIIAGRRLCRKLLRCDRDPFRTGVRHRIVGYPKKCLRITENELS